MRPTRTTSTNTKVSIRIWRFYWRCYRILRRGRRLLCNGFASCWLQIRRSTGRRTSTCSRSRNVWIFLCVLWLINNLRIIFRQDGFPFEIFRFCLGNLCMGLWLWFFDLTFFNPKFEHDFELKLTTNIHDNFCINPFPLFTSTRQQTRKLKEIINGLVLPVHVVLMLDQIGF